MKPGPTTSSAGSRKVSVVAQRISTTLPQYLIHLAHEPLVGLYYLCTHAKSRAAPALASAVNHMKRRSSALSSTILDIKDATMALKVGVVTAQKILDDVYNELNEACEILSS